jgi:hypothetical protein
MSDIRKEYYLKTIEIRLNKLLRGAWFQAPHILLLHIDVLFVFKFYLISIICYSNISTYLNR